jgi:hypothetical protein
MHDSTHACIKLEGESHSTPTNKSGLLKVTHIFAIAASILLTFHPTMPCTRTKHQIRQHEKRQQSWSPLQEHPFSFASSRCLSAPAATFWSWSLFGRDEEKWGWRSWHLNPHGLFGLPIILCHGQSLSWIMIMVGCNCIAYIGSQAAQLLVPTSSIQSIRNAAGTFLPLWMDHSLSYRLNPCCSRYWSDGIR